METAATVAESEREQERHRNVGIYDVCGEIFVLPIGARQILHFTTILTYPVGNLIEEVG